MTRNAILLASLLLTGFAVPVFGDDLAKAEEEFREYGKAMVGVWTTTDEDGNVKEHEYRWIADKKFIQVDVIKDDFKGTAIIGIDQTTHKITAWWFGNGKDGPGHIKVVQTKIGDHKWRDESNGMLGGKPWKGKGTFSIDAEKGILTGESQTTIDGVAQESKPGPQWTRGKRGT